MPVLKPTGTKLLVTPYRRERSRGGGIMLTEKNRDSLMGDDHIFWVVAVGEKVKDVKVKDRVVCKFDHDGLEYLTDGTKRAFINLHEVLLIIEPDF